MNTSKLKTFAQQSRRILMEGVKQKLRYWGFNEKGEVIDEPQQVGGGIIIRGEPIDDPTVLPKWEALKKSIRRHGVDATIEEAAYTWFNRLMAIRILSKNGYDAAQLEYEGDGSHLPVILAKARRGMTSYLNKEEQERLQVFLTDYSQETKAFAILITGYCHHHKLLNRVFGRLNDFTELLLPDNILAEKGFIHLLNTTDAIAEDNYQEVELIGWLYQFYISEKKDEVFKGFKKNKKAEAEDIPAATQIFTPNWIVKYMVQNTAGRIWLDHHPDSNLRQQMKYLVEPPADDSTERPLSPLGGNAKGASLLLDGDPIYLRLLDPACGSGHILVEGFSLLYEMYMEEFYMPAEAVENILTKNLFGLELDLRAAQLARFSVLLAAAKREPEILKKDILPRIYAMPEPAEFSRQEILDFLGEEGTQHEKVLSNVLQLMQQAQNLGSVMQFNVKEDEFDFFKQRWETLQNEGKTNLTTNTLVQKLEPFLNIFFTLTSRYEAIAANPPYMGRKNMNNELRKYLIDYFPTTKSDLCTVFIELLPTFSISYGKYSFIVPPSWMFLSSFEKLRYSIITTKSIDSLLHLSRGVFGADFGAMTTVISNFPGDNSKGNYYRLVERTFQEFYQGHLKQLFINALNNPKFKYDFKSYTKENPNIVHSESGLKLFFPNVKQSNFSKIPGNPFAYWVSKKVIQIYENEKNLDLLAKVRTGMQTGGNAYFVRLWHEITTEDFGLHLSKDEARISNKKWFPYNKGGGFKKWFGNAEYVVDWMNDGQNIKTKKEEDLALGKITPNNSKCWNEELYFKESISWSKVAIGNVSFRLFPQGFIFDVAGCSIFPNKDFLYEYLSGLLNSKVVSLLLAPLSPTINFEPGQIKKIPIVIAQDNYSRQLVKICFELSQKDWDSYETSWGYKNLNLFSDAHKLCSLEKSYKNWLKETTEQFYLLHANEEELNRIFIDIYGLNEELDPVVPLKDITILQEEIDRSALEKTEKELRKHRQWKLEEGKWKLYMDDKLVPPPTEGELPPATVQPELPIKKDVVMRQLISYAIGCMMGRYSLDKPGLILANQGETLQNYLNKVELNEEEISYLPDDDAIIPLMGSNCGFSDDAVYRLRHFIEVVWGSETLTQNINFLQSCLDMDLEKYLTNQNHFWKDHCSRYKKKPIYWLFSSPKGAFQALVYMHRMNKFTVQKIRDNYLLKHLQWLNGQITQLSSSSSRAREEQRQLDYYRKALDECEEYNNYLKDIADQQIEIDLDDGVAVNYPKFEPVVAKIK